MGTDVSASETGFNDVIAELRSGLSGEVVAAGDAGYEAASRVWNGMYDERRPVAVLRPADEEDVRRAVAALAEVEAPLAIRRAGSGSRAAPSCTTSTRRAPSTAYRSRSASSPPPASPASP
jgi:FAD/FMN-containing dehydrogenase